MLNQDWKNIIVSPCETFHLFNHKPFYLERYCHVMKYHEPGLAPVKTEQDAFHIDVRGLPAYTHRFLETFGFYEGVAAVRDLQGCFHIRVTGESVYKDRYLWCGNFQEGYCTVRKADGYFHINKKGENIYREKYAYVGDFKDGVAVVCHEKGLSTHIDGQGNYLHNGWFLDLDVYHKGFARAKDEHGWFHVNKRGEPIYKARYEHIEPFYNGVARVRTFEGDLITINIAGDSVTKLSSAPVSWQALSNDMVGFWRTEIIAAAASLRLFDYLPGTTSMIARQADLPCGHLQRLLRALWELCLVSYQEDIWRLTKKGKLLLFQDEKFLSSAAIMWSDVNSQSWKNLAKFIRTAYSDYHPVFKASASDEKLNDYHRAIDGYVSQDCEVLISSIDWKSHNKVIGVERNSKVILEKLLISHTHLQATLLGEAYNLKYANVNVDVSKRFFLKEQDILKPWISLADAILLPKVLPSWPDPQVIDILKNAAKALSLGGKIYLFEMILNENSPNGSLLDLNMLIETGGKLRFLRDWENLFCSAHLNLKENIMINQGLNLFILQR